MGLAFSMPRRKCPPRLALQIAVVLAIISLLPTPVYLQYFALCIPFLLVSAVCAVNDLLVTVESRRGRLVAATACVTLLSVYLGSSANDFCKCLTTGDEMPAGRRLQRVLEVSQAIDQVASPGEMVASFWPAYVFQSKATPFPGFENDFGFRFSEKLTSQQRARYHTSFPGRSRKQLRSSRATSCCTGKRKLFDRGGDGGRSQNLASRPRLHPGSINRRYIHLRLLCQAVR